MEKESYYNSTRLLWLVFIVTIIRYYYISPLTYATNFQLFFDEAQYWTWSKNLDFGYFSKPPIIAWLLYGVTSIFGDSTFAIKLASPIIHAAIAMVIYLIGKELTNSKTSFWGAIIYLTLPSVTAASAFISSDTPLLFFWSISLLFFIKALDSPNSLYWLAMGISVGLGLMSKYTMIAFYPSIGLYLLFTKECRKYLFGASLWIAVGLSAVIFAPNILWNYANDFISFAHNKENVLSNGTSYNISLMLEFIASQFGVFGPILFATLLWILPDYRNYTKDREGSFLFYTTFTLLIVAIIFSFISGAQAHWAAPAYISGSLLIAHYFINLKKKTSILRFSTYFHIICAIIFFHINFIYPIITPNKNPLERIERWNILADETSKILQNYKNTYLFTDERKSVAILMYRLKDEHGNPYPVLKWNSDKKPDDYYDIITDMNEYKKQNFIFSTRTSSILSFHPFFEKIELLKTIDIHGKKFFIYHMTNFKGY